MNNFTQNVFTTSKNSFKNFVATLGLTLLFLVGSMSFGQTNVTYTAFTTPVCPANPVATISTPPTGLTFSQMSRGSGVTCGNTAGCITGSGFNGTLAANISGSKWFTFSITSDASNTFTLNSLSIVARVSNVTGAPTFSVQYNIGGGAMNVIGSFTPTTSAATYTVTPGSAISVGTSQVLNVFIIPVGLTTSGTTARVENSTSINVTNTTPLVTTDWCNLQGPTTTQNILQGSSVNVYAQAYKAGLTEAAGAGTGLSAWVGYSSTNNNPSNTGWTWVPATFNVQVGNNDEFMASIGSGLAVGTYYFASRFQIGTSTYTYGGTGGVWNNDNVMLNVNSNLVDWCNIQFPTSGTITQGDSYNVYTQVYEPGTEAAGAMAGISSWVGYSTSNTNPNTWTNWVPATFNVQSGSNDEYVANIATSLAPGNYFYASRYQKSGSTEYVYGGTTGLWSSNSGTLTVIAPIPVVTADSPTGTYGAVFNYNISATNSPTSYAVSSGILPTGLSLNTTTGAITGTPTAAGSFSVDVTATNSGGTSTPATLSFTIAKANQTITFGALSAVTTATAPYSLTATASSLLSVTYSSSNTAVATISGNTITIVGAGTTIITASQVGDSNYNPATNVVQTLTVYDVASQLVFVGVPATGTVGVNLASFTVEARRTDNSIDTFYNTNIVLTKASGSGNLVGTSVSATPVNGVATFTTAQFDAASTYTLYADSGSLSQITSGSIVVNLAPVSIFANVITGTNPNTSNPYILGQTFNSNITVSGIGRGSGIIGTNANDRYNASGWITAGIDLNDYFEFALTPNSGYYIDFNNLVYTSQTSGTGPTSFAIRSSQDGFVSNIATPSSVGGTVSLSNSSFDLVSSAITFRLYGFNASGGTYSVNDFDFRGNVLCIQPTAYNVTGGGTICAGSTGTLVGLSNSQVGINYQLKVNGSNIGSPVAGTGAAISFGNQNTLGTYTVEATNTNGTCNELVAMIGSISISAGATTTWAITSPATSPAWDNGVPTSTMTAIIAANYSEVADIDACTLTVNNNAVVTIPSGSNITLNGALTVASGSSFTLNSNANLVQTTDVANSGNITVRRTTNPLMRFDYVMWSSPVDGTQSLLNFSPLTSVSPTVRFYTYDGSSDQYVSASSTSAEFLNATGYLIRLPYNHPTTPVAWTGSFVGQPNNGPISLSTTSGLYYATGNPYPSTIDADEFITENSLSDALYFWRKTNGATGSHYATYTLAGGTTPSPGTAASSTSAVPNGTIQVGQGFLAKATSTSLAFNNQMRIANNANQTFRSSSNALSTSTIERNRIWLNLSNATATIGQTMVSYMTGATNTIDAQIDGRYINDSQTALTSIITGQEFAIQGKTLPFDVTDVVPLGFKSETSGNFSISLYDKDGLFANTEQQIYLKDNQTGAVHNLNTGAYAFTSDAGVFNNRFEVIYQNTLDVDTPSLTSNNVIVYNDNNVLTINTGIFDMASVKVFDIRGRLLTEKANINTTQTTLNVEETNQILLVQVTSNDGIVVTKKVGN